MADANGMTAAELRDRADAMEQLEDLQDAAAEAKAAYRENLDDEDAKAAHRAASQALADARAALREAPGAELVGGDAVVTPVEDGSDDEDSE